MSYVIIEGGAKDKVAIQNALKFVRLIAFMGLMIRWGVVKRPKRQILIHRLSGFIFIRMNVSIVGLVSQSARRKQLLIITILSRREIKIARDFFSLIEDLNHSSKKKKIIHKLKSINKKLLKKIQRVENKNADAIEKMRLNKFKKLSRYAKKIKKLQKK